MTNLGSFVPYTARSGKQQVVVIDDWRWIGGAAGWKTRLGSRDRCSNALFSASWKYPGMNIGSSTPLLSAWKCCAGDDDDVLGRRVKQVNWPGLRSLSSCSRSSWRDDAGVHGSITIGGCRRLSRLCPANPPPIPAAAAYWRRYGASSSTYRPNGLRLGTWHNCCRFRLNILILV